jgi:hypothetical protein
MKVEEERVLGVNEHVDVVEPEFEKFIIKFVYIFQNKI